MGNLPLYALDAKVKLRDADITARVASYTVDRNGITYTVTWFHNGELKSASFYENELEAT